MHKPTDEFIETIQDTWRIFAVIPVFNRLSLTLRCLETLLADKPDRLEVILVDDGSTDGTSAVVAKRFPQVRILRGDGSLWWTGATRLGVAEALKLGQAGDYVLLLNNDLVVPPDYVNKCRWAICRHPRALIGSVNISETDGRTILSGGVRINWMTAKLRNLNGGMSIDSFETSHVERVSVLTGRGVLIPFAAFTAVGLYDDIHFKQGGDTELPRRAQLVGFDLVVDYSLRVYTPAEAADVGIKGKTRYAFADIVPYFFDIRSKANLRDRFWFAWKTRVNIVQGLLYFVCDLVRVGVHFLSRVRLSGVS